MAASVSVVIPAYNEGPRVGQVVRAAVAAELPAEVLVVDDGSRDDTVAQALAAGARVLRMPVNGGKARAMDAGAEAASCLAICFLDADLTGIRPDHIDSLIREYMRGAKMVVGPLSRTLTKVMNGEQTMPLFAGVFAGPRVMSKASWQFAKMTEPTMISSGYGVEVILQVVANRSGWRVAEVELDGIEFHSQGAKWGTRENQWWFRAARSAKMWGRVMRAASQASGKRLMDDVVLPLLRGGWTHPA
jgi:glycosyltransferase involved in cell wall biosynthesis